jgi:hypothetical protein
MPEMIRADRGVNSDGFTTMAFPAVTAEVIASCGVRNG